MLLSVPLGTSPLWEGTVTFPFLSLCSNCIWEPLWLTVRRIYIANIQKRSQSYLIRVSAGYDKNGKQIVKSMTWKPGPNMSQKQIEKEVQKQAVLFEQKCNSGQYVSSSIKFSDFSDIWLEKYAEKQLKTKTLLRYTELLKRINQALGHISLEKLQPIHIMNFYDNLQEEGIRADIKYQCAIDLKQEIHNLKMTKNEFAQYANVSTTTIFKASTGNNISYSSACKIASALQYKLENTFIPQGDKTTLSGNTVLYYHRVLSSILQDAVEWQIIPSNPCSRVKPPKAEQKESILMIKV